MTSVVTGSSGHLGEAVIRTLRAAGRHAIGVDIKPSPFTDVVASVADREAMQRVITPGVDTVYHTATLHKPHVVTHSRQAFVDTNITGTLVLLECAAAVGVRAFIFTSTTSVFGDAMRPPPDTPATWVTESVTPVPRNIYGVTKSAAEDLCELFQRTGALNVLVLRTSRFFPEVDDDRSKRAAFVDANIKANEFLYRRVDIEDVVDAHLLAAERAPLLGFGRYIISATTPFVTADLAGLNTAAPAVVERRLPGWRAVYARLGWRMFERIDRVYVNDKARRDLNWAPRYDFRRVLEALDRGDDPRSPLARAVGAKGYHDRRFEDGPFPVPE